MASFAMSASGTKLTNTIIRGAVRCKRLPKEGRSCNSMSLWVDKRQPF